MKACGTFRNLYAGKRVMKETEDGTLKKTPSISLCTRVNGGLKE